MLRKLKVYFLFLFSFLLFGCVPQPLKESAKTYQSQNISETIETDQKEEVALYIHTYSHLPSNYMTKKEARLHGWESGALSKILPVKSIGGDRYGNYEEVLPVDDVYYECDIDTEGKTSRGKKRIVYSKDGDIWYTEDHYDTFKQLYEGE